MSFLQLEGLHVFVSGAAGGIGSAIVEEFLGRCVPSHSLGFKWTRVCVYGGLA